MKLDIDKVAVIGHGLIGASIAIGLQRLDQSLDLVTLDRGDSIAGAAGADVIFLCAAIPENIHILSALPSHVLGEALVTDTGSTKRTTVAAAASLPPRLRFIGGHPMAGATTTGPAGASGTLFAKRPWILTPDANTRDSDLVTLRTLIESLGASVSIMDADEHDRTLAYVSHLPQLAVSALMQSVGTAVGERGLAVAGAGLRDSTRIASSPAALWQAVVDSNGDNVDAALTRLIHTLQQLRDDRETALRGIFEEAAAWKRALDAAESS